MSVFEIIFRNLFKICNEVPIFKRYVPKFYDNKTLSSQITVVLVMLLL